MAARTTAIAEDAKALLQHLEFGSCCPALGEKPPHARDRKQLMAILKAALRLLKRKAARHPEPPPTPVVRNPEEENRQIRLDPGAKEFVRRQVLDILVGQAESGDGELSLAELIRRTRTTLPFHCGKSHVPIALKDLPATGSAVKIGLGRRTKYRLGSAAKATCGTPAQWTE